MGIEPEKHDWHFHDRGADGLLETEKGLEGCAAVSPTLGADLNFTVFALGATPSELLGMDSFKTMTALIAQKVGIPVSDCAAPLLRPREKAEG